MKLYRGEQTFATHYKYYCYCFFRYRAMNKDFYILMCVTAETVTGMLTWSSTCSIVNGKGTS